MDGRGGCCIARYAGGAYETEKVDRIMLRFRPIAPKPACGGSVSGGSKPDNNNNNGVLARTGRTKRRYVRDRNKRCSRKSRRYSPAAEKKYGFKETAIKTPPLLPETPDRKDTPVRRSSSDLNPIPTEKTTTEEARATAEATATAMGVQYLPSWMNLNSNNSNMLGLGLVTDGSVVMPQTVRVVLSCVTMECVTDAWLDGGGLGSTDEEKRKSLDVDACPSFISDGLNRVRWTNEAYKEMVVGPGQGGVDDREGGGGEMMVWLVMRQRLPVTYPAFACRVRLQYTCGKERNSLTVPCDVWRMDDGGLAWRLDVKAALSLGR